MRNIVLVTIDSLRADHCGFLGYDRDTTPALDRMAADGISFTNAIAPGGKTPESMPVIFTGQYPFNRAKQAELNEWRDRIRPHLRARDTITDQFARAGYTTLGFTSNSFTSRYFGFDTGFDHFQDYFDQETRPGVDVPSPIRGLIKFLNRSGSFKPWTDMFEDVVTRTKGSTEPFFLWVMLMDTHVPYFVPREHRQENSFLDMLYANWRRGSDTEKSDSVRRKIVSAYDDTVRYVDRFLERLQDALSDLDPIYVVHSDHGEGFGEHGRYGHSGLLFEENIHVPLTVSNLGFSAEYDEPFSLARMPALLTTLRRGDRPEPATNVRPIVSRTEIGHRFAVRGDRYKLIRDEADNLMFFDLERDPSEEVNRIGDKQDIAELFDELGYRCVRWDDEKFRISSETKGMMSDQPRV